jgi:hypothetical protein
MQGGKNWILPKEMNANRFFWYFHWLIILSNHFCPSMGPNGGSVAMDSGSPIVMSAGITVVEKLYSVYRLPYVHSSTVQFFLQWQWL